MKISAEKAADPSDLLDRSRELYRDLSNQLQGQIAQLKVGDGNVVDCKTNLDAIKAHRKALQTVLDLEASFEKHSEQWNGGTGRELDLDAARKEILARFAVWSARK